MTKEERRLWYDFLKTYPVKFRRQAVIGKYIVDFYSPDIKLVIELNGSQHYEDREIERDEEREKFFGQYGLTVIGIPNNMVHSQFEGVCEYIDDYVKHIRGQSPQSPIGDGSPY